MKAEKYYKNGTILGFIPRKIEAVDLNEKINSLIIFSDKIYHVKNVIVNLENKINPRFDATHKNLYLPAQYQKNNLNIYNILYKYFNDKTEEIIAFHEMGHGVENDRKDNINLIDIKNNPKLNYLFNGGAIPNKINNFLQENFKEGYADCYSGLCYYKKHGDIQVFEEISKAREQRYLEMKNEHGNDYIHPNFNTQAPRIFKAIIEDLKGKGNVTDIFKLPFAPLENEDNIEKYLESAVIQGCLISLVKELENNDSFLNHFRKFANEFTKESNGINKITQHDKSIKEYAQRKNKILPNLIKDLNDNSFLPYVIDFQRKSDEGIVSPELVKDLIDNPNFHRIVDKNLQLMDVKEIPYSAGMENLENIEKKVEVKKINIKLNILSIRNNLQTKSNNSSQLKF